MDISSESISVDFDANEKQFYEGLFTPMEKQAVRVEQVNIRDKMIKNTEQSLQGATTLQQKISKQTNRARVNKSLLVRSAVVESDEDEQKLEQQLKKAQKGQTIFTDMEFQQLKLGKCLIKALGDIGFENPTKIQHELVPLIMAGRDVQASSCTGSGKTAAFLLPILERYSKTKREHYSKVLIMLPTRELALQCYEMFDQLNKYTQCTAALVIGAVPIQQQEAELRRHPDIIFCTPGRMVDLVKNSFNIDLQSLEVLVLDEADRLMEMGFEAEISEILKEIPADRQTILISATMNNPVQKLAQISLRKPVTLNIDYVACGLAQNLKQYIARIKSTEINDREACLLALLNTKFQNKTIIFAKTKLQCHRLAILLGFHEMQACELHGNLSQQQRLQAFSDFKNGKFDYLLATDLASRGLDIADVKAVINFEIPSEINRYIHRVGRTARIGSEGVSVTLCLTDEVLPFKRMIKQQKQPLFKIQVNQEIMNKFRDSIHNLQPQISAIFKEERVEKELRKAEMLTRKAENMMTHEEDIMRKPRRQWVKKHQYNDDDDMIMRNQYNCRVSKRAKFD